MFKTPTALATALACLTAPAAALLIATSATASADPANVTQPPSAVSNVDWMRKPTGEDIERAYPERALSEKVAGRVVIECVVNARGRLDGCHLFSEEPATYGFGDAALSLSRFYVMRTTTSDGLPTEGRGVRIPINFRLG